MLQRREPTPHSVAHLAPSKSALVTQLLAKLKPYNGMTLDSGQLKDIVGADSKNGVGPKLRSLRNSFKREDLDLDSYIEPQRKTDGTVVWKIVLPADKA